MKVFLILDLPLIWNTSRRRDIHCLHNPQLRAIITCHGV